MIREQHFPRWKASEQPKILVRREKIPSQASLDDPQTNHYWRRLMHDAAVTRPVLPVQFVRLVGIIHSGLLDPKSEQKVKRNLFSQTSDLAYRCFIA